MPATAAASSPASPSATSGTARGEFRSASPIDVSVVKVRHSRPYGLGSSKGHEPTATIVPTTTSSAK